jgi:hypothetical protein
LVAALTVPYLLAALVLCTAGVAKLRMPASAAQALRTAGLPGARHVRAIAAFELALGGWALVAPGRVAALAVCAVYLLFAGLAAFLARRASSCGCFGTTDAPATVAQSALSAAIALLTAAAAVWHAQGMMWVLHRPPAVATVLAIGLAGAAWAAVLAYTELPTVWSAWGRT